jgi:hypothetical protein
MRYFARALLAGGLGFAVSFIAGCGGGAGLIPADQASTLNSQLDQVSSALAAGNCTAVRSAAQSLVSAEANLPSTVNSKLRADLNNGVSTVSQRAVVTCHAVTTAATTTTPTTTATTTATTATTTTPTTTATTTSNPTTPATTSTPTGTTSTPTSGGGGLSGGSNGGGQGLGNGNGNGNG